MIKVMINYYRSTVINPELKRQNKLSTGGWALVERPSERDIERMASLGIDRDILNDTLDPYEVPRLETDDDYTYFIARIPDSDDDLGGFTTPLLFAISDRHLITVCRDRLPALSNAKAIKQVPTTQRGKLFLALISVIIEQYERQVAVINRRMRAIALDVSNIRSCDIAVFTKNERMINDYLDALIPMNIALEKMLGNRWLSLFDNDPDLVEDLSIDLEQLIVRCKAQLRTITNLRDSYRAVMDTRLNETLRILTVITVVMTVPTVVAGIFGMNVALPGNVNSPLAFWLIILGSTVVSAVIGIYFLRRR